MSWDRPLAPSPNNLGDPFSGSCTTAAIAERHDRRRRWIAIDRSLSFLARAAGGRFPNETVLPIA